MVEKKWWKEAVAYEIYPRSFMDSNGDGIGDLPGIASRLDYLKELGVDVIWICPMYRSPNDDNGYDISDYRAIMDEFGTMADFDRLLAEVHGRGMRLILDLVVNHTSDEHPWFAESRASCDNPKRDYYIWRDGKNGAEPNNWESIFSGPAWEYDAATDQYYMHIFSRKQPDLNWENPAMRREIYAMINWWLDKGIDGFRIDAITHIKKVPGLPDLPNPDKLPYVSSFKGHRNREGIHELVRELTRETFQRYDIMTVGEAGGVRLKDARDWVGAEPGKFNMIFQFETNNLWENGPRGTLDLVRYKEVMTGWQKALEGYGWNALFLENHDLPRSVSTWGDDGRYWKESAKALGTMFFLMQGTPFLYQGQEIGMTNVRFATIEEYNDVSAKNLYRIQRAAGVSHEAIMEGIWRNGRDNSRTPMQWSDEENAGFTTGTPWLKVNPNYREINVRQAMADPDSIYHFYRKLIRLRKEHPAALYGTYDLILPEHPEIYAYTRTLEGERLLVLANLFPAEAACELQESLRAGEAELLLANLPVETLGDIRRMNLTLRPYESRVYLLH